MTNTASSGLFAEKEGLPSQHKNHRIIKFVCFSLKNH
jgi:hypothetical protein